MKYKILLLLGILLLIGGVYALNANAINLEPLWNANYSSHSLYFGKIKVMDYGYTQLIQPQSGYMVLNWETGDTFDNATGSNTFNWFKKYFYGNMQVQNNATAQNFLGSGQFLKFNSWIPQKVNPVCPSNIYITLRDNNNIEHHLCAVD